VSITRYIPKKKSVRRFSIRLKIPGIIDCSTDNCRFDAISGKRADIAIKYDRKNAVAYFDAETAGTALEYRSLRITDKFQPLGEDIPRRVSHFLKTRKPGNRLVTGIVAKVGGEIVWIPGIAVSHNFRITKKTGKILKISYSQTP
jgi:hypothetical protein